MSRTKHYVRSTTHSRARRRIYEPLEPRLLLAIDVFDAHASRGFDSTLAEDAAPAADLSTFPLAGAIDFPDIPDFGGPDHWNLNAARAPESWARGYSGQGVVVAVVDSGVDIAHPALHGQIWSNADEIMGDGIDDGNGFLDDAWGWDFVDDEPLPADESGHGTHLAGIIAGRDNGTGITGIAPGAKIMPVRVLNQRNTGYLVHVAAGIRYAAENGADIINVSIGGEQDADVAAAIEFARDRDVLVVAAAGNGAAETPTYPAALSATMANTISVGAYRAAGTLGSFSNSVGDSGAVQVDAPGIYIHSAFAGGGTMYMSGTSMATAHVSGIAALALSANPSLTAVELRNLIVAGADRQIEGSDAQGALNAARTVALAEAMRPASIKFAPVATASGAQSGGGPPPVVVPLTTDRDSRQETLRPPVGDEPNAAPSPPPSNQPAPVSQELISASDFDRDAMPLDLPTGSEPVLPAVFAERRDWMDRPLAAGSHEPSVPFREPAPAPLLIRRGEFE